MTLHGGTTDETLSAEHRPARQKKASLQPLIAALPDLSMEGYEFALRSSALHLQGRDNEIDSACCDLLYACVLPADVAKLLNSCCHLLRQVGRKGGMTREKLETSLVPLGFLQPHVQVLADVLDWVRNGSPTDMWTQQKSSPPASPPPVSPTEPAALEEVEAPVQPIDESCEAADAESTTDSVQLTADESVPAPDDAITPRSQAELASKYLGRLSHVAEDAARIQVVAMQSEAKSAEINSSLPRGKWGIMTWKERLEFLQSCPNVGHATVVAQQRAKLRKRIQTGLPLDAYVVESPFNGSVLKPPAWREDEDLSLDVGDIVLSVGPAPYGKKGWSIGFNANNWKAGCGVESLDAHDVKVFPSSIKYVRRIRCEDITELSDTAVDALTCFNTKEVDPTFGYSAVPRVPVDAVEVTGAVSRAVNIVGRDSARKTKTVVYYSVHCAGPDRESWTVQRRYSEFETLRHDLLHAATMEFKVNLERAKEIATFRFPSKHSPLTATKLRDVRVQGFNEWLSSVHTFTSRLGRTSYLYILLRRFLRPDSPLRQRFTGFEHNGQSFPQVDLRVYPDTDAKATAEYVAMKLGIQEVSTFSAQLSKFITANGRLRLEVDHLVSVGLGVQYVMVLPSDPSAEVAVNRFAMRVKEDLEFEISDGCKREIVEEVRQRMRRV